MFSLTDRSDLKEAIVKAKRGIPVGQYYLGVACHKNPLFRSSVHAYAWVALSVINGMESEEILDEIARGMTQDEIKRAKEKIADLIEENPALINDEEADSNQ